jgi:hypothetical protein
MARFLLLATAGLFAKASRVGVLVHGFDLGADDWEEVVWGTPREGRLGRVPHGLLLSRRFKATTVVLGSGGTCDESGVSEAERTRAHAILHLSELSRLPHADVRALRRLLEKHVVLLEAARNTRQELEAARVIFRQRGVDTVVIVSSPTHAPRCLRDASLIFGSSSASPAESPTILASPCSTDFGCGGATVIEPQHRSDRPRWLDADPGLQLSELVGRSLRVASWATDGAFHRDLDRLIRRYERRGNKARPAALPAAGPRRCRVPGRMEKRLAPPTP